MNSTFSYLYVRKHFSKTQVYSSETCFQPAHYVGIKNFSLKTGVLSTLETSEKPIFDYYFMHVFIGYKLTVLFL
jgi:hypothetical protein